MPPVTVECDNNYDPPQIRVMFRNQESFMVSQGIYDLIKGPLGLPDSPCSA